MENIRRINVGNFNNFEILQKNLILRNQNLKNRINM